MGKLQGESRSHHRRKTDLFSTGTEQVDALMNQTVHNGPHGATSAQMYPEDGKVPKCMPSALDLKLLESP